MEEYRYTALHELTIGDWVRVTASDGRVSEGYAHYIDPNMIKDTLGVIEVSESPVQKFKKYKNGLKMKMQLAPLIVVSENHEFEINDSKSLDKLNSIEIKE